MPSIQLTKGVSQIATATATVNPATASGTNIAASITKIRGISLASSSTQFIPTNEYWYITGIYVPTTSTGAVNISIANALLITFVNDAPQPYAPSEAEVQQNLYNKLALPPQEWIQLPNGQAFQQAIQPTVTVTTTTTTVTFQETFLRMPLGVMQ